MSPQESLFQELDEVQVIGSQIQVHFFFFLSMVLTISSFIRRLSQEPVQWPRAWGRIFYVSFTAALDILAGS
jgi:hypothetical protein